MIWERRLMAAEVSSLSRMLRGYDEEGDGKRELVTRDLLGGGGAVLGSAEVGLELRVPMGWERRFDLLHGKTYLEKRDPDPVPSCLHNLNLALPPPSTAALVPQLDAAAAPAPSAYQSVCTLEKVKSALERATRRSDGSPSPRSSSTTTTSSSFSVIKRRAPEEDGPGPGPGSLMGERGRAAAMTVAGCPACLLYVLVSSVDPRCPRCAVHVPVIGEHKKRPKLDLNSPTRDGDDDEDSKKSHLSLQII
ncbi:hypothetical protein C4D60_Mb11t16230 [Musa balbisiana]|uniref:GIR1-like zinc ribbon domain-containing protein n=1 Tax=Musa balbisiana TaxID=52838 RepID=A0A4S8J4I2_MUSBA|nr:hypothetical protein C4D60_Mb11t16230 [Musa balbisiana]